MRISAQNNQFIFNLPIDFITKRLEDKYLLLFEKNWIPYESVIEYINSTIKEIVFPSISIEFSEQILKRGKRVNWKDAKNIHDQFNRELDITFRSVDAHLNYFMLMEIINDFQLNTDEQYIPLLNIHILDKDGDILFTVNLREVLFSSLSENRLSYNITDFSEKTFSLTIKYNFIDIYWLVDDDSNIDRLSSFDVPTKNINDREVVERKNHK